MNANQAVDYIAKHGRYNAYATDDARYSVRFPPTASRSLFAADTLSLRNKLMVKANLHSRKKNP